MIHLNPLDNLQFNSHEGLNGLMVEFKYRHLAQYFRGSSCLELGCADGNGIELLQQYFEKIVAVDGSERLLNELHRKYPNVETHASYFEKLDLEEKFDTIHLGHVLEHVDDPQVVLQVVQNQLAPNGVVIASVPNGHSIHRQLGVKMNIVDSCTSLGPADIRIGHQRVYTPGTFKSEFKNFNIIRFGGLFFKPFSNSQLESWLDGNQISALFELGTEYPELAADIYIVAELGS